MKDASSEDESSKMVSSSCVVGSDLVSSQCNSLDMSKVSIFNVLLSDYDSGSLDLSRFDVITQALTFMVLA